MKLAPWHKSRNFILVSASLIPLLICSILIINSDFRDNANYSRAFGSIKPGNNISDSYASYTHYIGSVEPFLFIYYYLMKSITVNFLASNIIKNIFFIIQVAYLSRQALYNNRFIHLFIIYLSTDFYLLRFMSELHRVHLAIIVLLPIFFTQKATVARVFIAMITHAQALLFIPLLTFSRSTVIGIGILFVILVASQFSFISSKIYYYLDTSITGPAKVIFFAAGFFLIGFRIPVTHFQKLLIITVVIAVSATFIGEERVLFIVVESFVFYGFYVMQFYTPTRPQQAAFMCFIILLVLYNLSRIYGLLGQSLLTN